jgi:DNA-binding NarL/FixJ family response regulator
VVKDIELSQLKSAIRSVYRGQTVLDPKISGALILRVTAADSPTEARPAAVLSELDVRIVRLLSEGHTIKEIAERVHLSAHTIKDRLARIRGKLAVRSRTGIVAEAIRRGLI